MGLKQRYIVCYDIADPKRLRRMFKKMKGFGEALQYSVFVCDLTPMQRIRLEEAIVGIINQREDRVVIVDVGPAGGRGGQSIKQIGRSMDLPGRPKAAVV